MRRTITWSDDAVGDLLKVADVNRHQANRIRDAVTRFGRDETGDIRKLRGVANRWRLRVGDWRVMYEEESDRTLILEVLNRRDAYDD